LFKVELALDRLAPDGLVEPRLAGDRAGRSRPGGSEIENGRRGRDQRIELGVRLAEVPRVAPVRPARKPPLGVVLKDSALERPVDKFRGGLPGEHLAKRLIPV
jgi:hypothetical protein